MTDADAVTGKLQTPVADPSCRPQLPTPVADPSCRPQLQTTLKRVQCGFAGGAADWVGATGLSLGQRFGWAVCLWAGWWAYMSCRAAAIMEIAF